MLAVHAISASARTSLESATTELRKAQLFVPAPTVSCIDFCWRHFFSHFAPSTFWKASTSPWLAKAYSATVTGPA